MLNRLLSIAVLLITLSLLTAAKNSIYQINPNRCMSCGRCFNHCPTDAIQFDNHSGLLYIVAELCNGCGNCVQYCPFGAIYQVTGNSDEAVPFSRSCLSCAPNPAPGYLDITCKLSESALPAILQVYNSKGRLLWQREITSGDSKVRWNGCTSKGTRSPDGIYLVRLVNKYEQITNKITMVRR